eukprot:TRINITY_DN84613_c0_g1_i1.p1 TRINITY_DN84613_c0_g1~~TRINITY_DN84613_c0_g1_i1.p1  ORF type:complete len:320 (-),score=60.31 TRINITY_DN84613_c0_g1_i1:168-1127(-)
MAPKKKPAKAAEGEVDYFEEFLKKYNKNQKEYETPKIPNVVEIISKIQDEGEDVKAWNFDREFDPMAFRIFCHTLRQTPYTDIEAIRVWKCGGGDESVRSVCYYLDMQPEPQVKDVHFADNGVTELGCEFLGRTLGPNGNKVVNLLRLDYNQFGTPGVSKLSLGLSQNSSLRQLSLQYCGIGEDGGQYIAQILMFHRNALEILELRGNYLRDRGVVDVFNGAMRKEALNKIDVFDNKFTDTPEVIKALRDLFANNVNLVSYNLGGNQISNAGASMLVNGMIGHSHLQQVMVTERCSAKTFEALEFQLSAGKGKKKGKKK